MSYVCECSIMKSKAEIIQSGQTNGQGNGLVCNTKALAIPAHPVNLS